MVSFILFLLFLWILMELSMYGSGGMLFFYKYMSLLKKLICTCHC